VRLPGCSALPIGATLYSDAFLLETDGFSVNAEMPVSLGGCGFPNNKQANTDDSPLSVSGPLPVVARAGIRVRIP
jgi:hypothetical protein